ncbi:MAG: permease prefix domain 1-containing protein [Chloroflexota bacterium]
MPDSLRTAYLQRLERELSLSDPDRAAAIEEIDGHVDDVIVELTERGLPPDVAERRALERLGAPERLAEALTAAHRTPRDVFVAAGVGLRVSVSTALWSFITVGVILFVVGVAFAALYVLAQRLAPVPRIELGADASTALLACAVAISAHAVGRAILRPVAIAAHHRPADLRPIVLTVGIAVTTWIGLTLLRQSWGISGAIIMALLPGWFAAGVMAPNLVPRWLPANRRLVGVAALAIIVLSVIGLSVAGPGTPAGEALSRESDPATEFAAIAPFDHWLSAPIDATANASSFVPIDRGAGPISWRETWHLSGRDALAGWTDLHVEVWASSANVGADSWVDADATGPLVSTPLVVRGRNASAAVSFEALPTHGFYHLAVVGTDPDGARQLVTWPSFRQWTWVGTPLEFLIAMVG